MKTDLYSYDVYPKVFKAGEEVRVTIKPLGRHAAFPNPARLRILPLNDRNFDYDGRAPFYRELSLTPDGDGCLRFTHTFEGEGEHFIRLLGDNEKKLMELSVYSVLRDLCGRYPFLGDTHAHTTRSDGRQSPEIVAADYRRQGYDFLSVTDHNAYVGSMDAIAAYKDAKIDLALIPGEEVHLPHNDVHIVNFGGLCSVNAMVDENRASLERRNPDILSFPPERWRGNPSAPFYTEAEYERQVREIEKSLAIPEGVDGFTVAACKWGADRIRECGGLPIFAHPYWQCDTFHVTPRMTDALFDLKIFDAFEVYGGERYMEQNESQVYHYMEALARGSYLSPIGASDEHGVYNNPGAGIGKTLVFAPENTREALISSIRDGYCAAVECISDPYRLCASLRFVRYARFILDNYYPLHDEYCVEEGRLMKAYACGDADAAKELKRLSGRTGKLLRKYFAV